MNVDPICLSSDDDYEPAPKISKTEQVFKKVKELNGIVNAKNGLHKSESVICLDSDEDDTEDVVLVTKVNVEEPPTDDKVDPEEVVKEKELDIAEPVENNEVQSKEPSKENEVDDLKGIEVISCDSPLNLSSTSSKSSKDGKESEVSDNDSSTTDYFEQEELQLNKEQNGETSQSEEQPKSPIYKESELMADTADLPKEAISFLSTCVKVLRKGSAEPIFKKFPIIIKMFRSLSDEFARTEYLSKFLKKQTKIAKESVSCCIISFREVYLHLKDSLNSQSIDLPKKHWKHVRKLEKVIELLLAKLKELEEEEVDFDDENEDDTAYVKHDKYSKRLCQVYTKYCEIMKKNPYAGRITHERLDFVSSNYNEINQAISKKYKNNKKFPSYDELATYIQGVVEEKKLPLSGNELKSECKECFKKLGDLLQTRRKKELYEAHQLYMTNEDPAKSNEDLDRRLRISSKERELRIQLLCEEYVKKQEMGLTGEEVDLSQSEEDEDSETDL